MKERKSRRQKYHPMIILSVGLLLCGSILFLSLFAAACSSEESTAVLLPEVSASQTAVETVSSHQSNDHIPVPYLSQEGTMPTGCELVSTVMVLHYYGIDLSVEAFANDYVTMEPIFVNSSGVLQGPHPNQAFVGDPHQYASYGCYAPVIVEAMNRMPSTGQAANTTGLTLEELMEQYVNNGTPALVWVTINMAPSYPGDQWFVPESGAYFTWTANEHCMVLVGADESGYYLLDPYNSNGLVHYSKELAAQRHAELGYQSVVYLAS